jgi:hypothetical protein
MLQIAHLMLQLTLAVHTTMTELHMPATKSWKQGMHFTHEISKMWTWHSCRCSQQWLNQQHPVPGCHRRRAGANRPPRGTPRASSRSFFSKLQQQAGQVTTRRGSVTELGAVLVRFPADDKQNSAKIENIGGIGEYIGAETHETEEGPSPCWHGRRRGLPPWLDSTDDMGSTTGAFSAAGMTSQGNGSRAAHADVPDGAASAP